MRREEKEEAGQGGEVRGKENERVVRRGVRGAKKEEQKGGGGGPVQPARKRRGTNGHRGVASSSACQPALPEMLTVPREINATGEKAVRVWWHTGLQVS